MSATMYVPNVSADSAIRRMLELPSYDHATATSRIEQLHHLVLQEFDCVSLTLGYILSQTGATAELAAAAVVFRTAVNRYSLGDGGPLHADEWDVILDFIKNAGFSALTGVGIVNSRLMEEWNEDVIEGVNESLAECDTIAAISSLHPNDAGVKEWGRVRCAALRYTWDKGIAFLRQVGPAVELVGKVGDARVYSKRVDFLTFAQIVTEAATALRDVLACHGVAGDEEQAVGVINSALEGAFVELTAAACAIRAKREELARQTEQGEAPADDDDDDDGTTSSDGGASLTATPHIPPPSAEAPDDDDNDDDDDDEPYYPPSAVA
jgi:hypothetical protein